MDTFLSLNNQNVPHGVTFTEIYVLEIYIGLKMKRNQTIFTKECTWFNCPI